MEEQFGKLTEWYRRPCLICGALVEDRIKWLELHMEWHKKLK